MDSALTLEVEIGAWGAMNPQSWQWMCKTMGFDSNTRDRLTYSVQDAAVHDIPLQLPQSMGDSTLA